MLDRDIVKHLATSAAVWGFVAAHGHLASITIPASISANASHKLTAAPVGVSLEFFTFPEYITNLTTTFPCLENLKDLSGTWPPMRIGGTTQDRATYNASQESAVNYYVAHPVDAPVSVTYGPSFLSLANTYAGEIILGLNRRLNNQPNTIAAAQKAVSTIEKLSAIELGNEPNFYNNTDPIANGSWNGPKDFASQVSWQSSVSSALNGLQNIFSAGVYFDTTKFSIQGLSAQEGAQIDTVKDFCSHNYPQGAGSYNLSKLMSHSAIKEQIAPFIPENAAARAHGKPHIMGETNSATQGGGGISQTFGAGLWVLDYVMQSLLLGFEALYFHQGTIGNSPYSWWGRNLVGTPYYGAYFAGLALANATQIAYLDNATTNYASYAVYEHDLVKKLLLINSDYYGPNSTTSRSNHTFSFEGIGCDVVTAIRLTAPSAEARQDLGENPTVGGQSFDNSTCLAKGNRVIEETSVLQGKACFTLAASEALLVYL